MQKYYIVYSKFLKRSAEKWNMKIYICIGQYQNYKILSYVTWNKYFVLVAFKNQYKLSLQRKVFCLLPSILVKCNIDIRSVQKVSKHFKYLKNWFCSHDITWKLIRGDLLAYVWIDPLPLDLLGWLWYTIKWLCVLCNHYILHDNIWPLWEYFHLIYQDAIGCTV